MNYKNFKIKDFCCEGCLADDILKQFAYLTPDKMLTIYAKADLMTSLLKNLLISEIDGQEFGISMLNLDGQCVDYDDVYVMNIDEDMNIWVEPQYRTEKGNTISIFPCEDEIAYVYQGDCNQELIEHLVKYGVQVILFGLDEEE